MLLTKCKRIRESDIQSIFDQWHSDRNGWRLAGVPSWLDRYAVPNIRPKLKTRGIKTYGFIPDVIWETDEPLVIELKYSLKFQSNALAEVLHHAWQLRKEQVANRIFKKAPVPVIVTAMNSWMRSALCHLFASGLQKDAVRYLEISPLEDEAGSRYLYMREPP